MTMRATPLRDQTNRSPSHQAGQKARLPSEFLSISTSPTRDSSLHELKDAADSPETLTTKITVRGTHSTVRALIDVAVVEVWFERELYPKDLFRTASKYGHAVHRLGSPTAVANAAFARPLAEGFALLERLDQLVGATEPDATAMIVLEFSSLGVVAERWEFEMAFDTGSGHSDPAVISAETRILLRQIARSSAFLPALAGPCSADLRTEVVVEELAPKAVFDGDALEDDDDDDSDEDETVAEHAGAGGESSTSSLVDGFGSGVLTEDLGKDAVSDGAMPSPHVPDDVCAAESSWLALPWSTLTYAGTALNRLVGAVVSAVRPAAQ